MADISSKITRKSLKAKRKAAIRTIKAQAKEKIRQVNMEYASNPERKKAVMEEKRRRKELRLQKANARLAYNSRQPRPHTFAEDLFNSIISGIGTGLSVAAIVLLVIRAYYSFPGPMRSSCVASFAIFGATLFIMYLMTTLHHAIMPMGAKNVFSVINRDAIYLLISGSAMPFLFARLSSPHAAALCAIIWIITGVLIALYSVFRARLDTFSTFTYLLMGWLVVLGFIAFNSAGLNYPCKAFMIAASLSYTAGWIFYLMKNFKWTCCIFHLFVLGGSIMSFFSVYYLA